MSIESTLSIIGSVIAIGGVAWSGYKLIKKKPLTTLMNELADKNTSIKRQKFILSLINKRLYFSKNKISSSYIKNFHSNGRSKLAIFYDICNQNDIEPTTEICRLLIGSDEPKFRNEWTAKHIKDAVPAEEHSKVDSNPIENKPQTYDKFENRSQVVYLSALIHSKFPQTCKRLTDILNKYHIPYAFLEGTKDIWCRDYMPIQTPSGKLIQFRYEPSYLKGNQEWENSRSDVREVDKINGFNPLFSDINLDGGNVVMFKNKAIITDRIFSENPDLEKDYIRKKLAELLECELIIIPALAKSYDYTGHADGMIRWVDDNTVIVNDLSNDSTTFKNKMNRAMRMANLNYIEFPYFDYKIEGNDGHAIGVYLNYLEVNNLIVMPVFGYNGNKDKEAFEKLKQIFPNKIIETIDYNEVALCGGILNCSTWIINK